MKKINKKKKEESFLTKSKNKINHLIKEKGLKNFILSIIMVGLIIFASLLLIFALYIIISSPNFDKDVLYSKEASVIYDINGDEIARIGQENRTLVTYDDLPQVFIDALIATEDSRFFQHNGLDIARFLKASMKQLVGKDEGGASTLSMQLIKKLYTQKSQEHESKGESLLRKFRDIYMAVFKLENSYTKEEILEFYANSLWFGNDGSLNYSGIYGVEEASQFFFNKSVSELTLAESSLLVGMYQNPNLYNPYRNPEGCRNRQTIVLKLMVLHGYITEEEKNAVLQIPIESLLGEKTTSASTNENQAVIDYVINEVREKTGNDPKYVSMKIYTTVNPKVQNVLNKMNKGELFTFYRTVEEAADKIDQVGAAVTDVETGAIVGISGGRNYVALGTNRATERRQPGSTAKPFFDYGPYIEYLHGSTGDYFFDDPYTYTNGTPITDADNSYQGMITIRQALVGSRNITALQAFQKVMKENPDLIPNYVHSFGLDYGDNLYESAAIGGFEGVSPIEMSAAYGVYARGGYYIKPYIFTKVIYEDSSTFEYKYTKEKVVSAETAYMITSMLIDAVTNGWSGSVKVRGTQVAGKTGTTNLSADTIKQLGLPAGTIPDSWTASYSPEYSIALWYGYDKLDSKYNMNTNTGWNARSRLMAELANNIYSTNKTFKRPSGVVSVEVEKYTVPLQKPSEYTPKDMRMTELFKEGTEPTEVSNRYAPLAAPTNGNATVSGNNVTLSWNGISTPEAINTSYLQQYFNDNYGKFASKYYEKRIDDNNTKLGPLGYQIYSKAADGNLSSLGWVSGTTFTQTIEPTQNYTFVVKSTYQIFKENASKGLEINVAASETISESQNSNTQNNTNNSDELPTNIGLD